MRRPDPRHESRNTTSITAWLPVLAAMAVMVTGCLSTFLVLQLDEFRPKVGDVVVFRPGSEDSDMWQMTVPATVVNQAATAHRTCSLDPNVIATDGGSLVVEQRQETPVLGYQVHWAGQHTDKSTADCGQQADLIVSRTDLQRLANAAGGFGIGDKGITR
jgi:hypothetical protein